MARIDEAQEAVARIRMLIDDSEKANKPSDEDIDVADSENSQTLSNSTLHPWDPPLGLGGHPPHWTFGSPDLRVDSCDLELTFKDNPSFKSFDERLRIFLSTTLGEERLQFEDVIEVSCALSNVPIYAISHKKIGHRLVILSVAVQDFMVMNVTTVLL
ncbi:hypothetical protein H0H92_012225 [Tricholoma furcatifolium]|nr:hypothetical protein H0H92_012225 [Tricholoma furcatifolium]